MVELQKKRVELSAVNDPTVTIKRDHLTHRWAILLAGAHTTQTPWEDTADVTRVALWLKSRANGLLRVKVDLS